MSEDMNREGRRLSQSEQEAVSASMDARAAQTGADAARPEQEAAKPHMDAPAAQTGAYAQPEQEAAKPHTDAQPGSASHGNGVNESAPYSPSDAYAAAPQVGGYVIRPVLRPLRAGAMLLRTAPPEEQPAERGKLQYRGVALEPGRLDLFELTDKTISLLEDMRPGLERMAERLHDYLTDAFKPCQERVLGTQSRVKAASSLRQKILRKSLYKRYNCAKELLDNLSDLVGVRVECRFLADEAVLFEVLRKFACARDDKGLSYAPGQPCVKLDLRGAQPQTQMNGLPIYRIDGWYEGENGEHARFELQIKALVHVFWAEVEHEIIYKNNAYLLMDGFMKSMLNSTYDHLKLVDSQLYTIYKTIQVQSEGTQQQIRNGALEVVLAKGINDMFFKKMQRSLGFTIDFKPSCDALSRYILRRARTGMNDLNIVTMLFHRVAYIGSLPLDFETPLKLERHFSSDIRFCDVLGRYFESRLNVDYNWNTFFRMLFVLEPGNNMDDMVEFLKMLYDRFASEDIFAPLYGMWSVREIQQYREGLLGMLAESMVAEDDISIIYESSLARREAQLSEVVEQARRSMGSEPLELPICL